MRWKKVGVVLVGIVLLIAAFVVVGNTNNLPASTGETDDMPYDVPDESTRDMDFQIAHNNEEIFMRFEWDREDPDWYHQYFVYEDGEWTRLDEFYEDRLSILLDDGSVQGFEGWGGWITAHEGMRDMFELPGEEVEEGIGEGDLRKYIPQSREGDEWWEAPWDEVVSEEEIEDMYDEKEFLDLWHVRTHRSVPIREGDSQHVIDYRRGDNGTGPFRTRDLGEDDMGDQPDYMYDTDIVEDGAIDVEDLREQNLPQDQFFDEYYDEDEHEWTHPEDPFYIHEDWLEDFDEDVAEWEGAVIPRRILQETEGSRGVLESNAWHEDTTWTAEISRELDTDYEDDNVIGEDVDNSIAFGIHDSAGTRFHFTSFPYNLELGDEFEVIEEEGEATIVSEYLGEGEEPDWDEDDWDEEIGDGEETITLPYPGLTSWQWVTGHLQALGHDLAEDSLWDAFPGPHGPEQLGELAYEMEEKYWETDVEVENLQVNGQSEDAVVDVDEEVEITAEADFPMNIPKPIELRVEDEAGDEVHSWIHDIRGEDEIERSHVHGDVWDVGEYTVILGDEEVSVSVEEDPDLPDIIVEDLTVNGEPDEVQIDLDEEVEITATVTNEGDAAATVDLIVEGADDEEGHFGHTLELGPGDSDDIEWIMEEHDTWDEGDYTIRLGEESVEVTVGEDLVDDEVDWDEMRIIIGLIIAAFVIGIGVGVIWSKKGY